MCGRYSLATDLDALTAFYDELGGGFYNPNGPRLPAYNIAPGQRVPAIRVSETGARTLSGLHWGLIPHWAKDHKLAYKMINARVETAHMKPAYRVAFRKARCLLPATGWYEWMRRPDRPKQPYHIHAARQAPFLLAGLWARWSDPEGEAIESCTILTRPAAGSLASIHDRMPVVIPTERAQQYLDPDLEHAADVRRLLARSATRFVAYPVGTHVNRPANDDARCLTREVVE